MGTGPIVVDGTVPLVGQASYKLDGSQGTAGALVCQRCGRSLQYELKLGYVLFRGKPLCWDCYRELNLETHWNATG